MTVKVGKIVNTHKLNGELRVLSNSDFKNQRFALGNTLYVDGQKVTIEKYYTHKTFDILKFVGLDSINDVEKFKNKFIEADDDIELAEGEYLNKDLVGLKMVSDECEYGEVINVIENPAHNLLKVKYNKITYLVPFNEHFIIDVDLENKIIYFNNMEGLINED